MQRVVEHVRVVPIVQPAVCLLEGVVERRRKDVIVYAHDAQTALDQLDVVSIVLAYIEAQHITNLQQKVQKKIVFASCVCTKNIILLSSSSLALAHTGLIAVVSTPTGSVLASAGTSMMYENCCANSDSVIRPLSEALTGTL